MATRLKTAAQPVPQTREEFEAAAVELGELIRATDRIGSETADAIGRLKLDQKKRTEPMVDKIKALWRVVSAYAEAHRDELLPKDRKSVSIAAGTLGWRIGKAKIDLGDEDADLIIEQLQDAGLDEFVRLIRELDKAAILAAPERLPKELAKLVVPGKEETFFRPLDSETEMSVKAPTPAREAA